MTGAVKVRVMTKVEGGREGCIEGYAAEVLRRGKIFDGLDRGIGWALKCNCFGLSFYFSFTNSGRLRFK